MPVTTADLVLDVKDLTGEGPVWSVSEGVLWWTDINGRRLHRFDPTRRALVTFPTPGRLGCFALRAHGGIVYAMEHAIGFADPEAGRFLSVVEPEANRVANRFNDGRCDPHGRFFAGSMRDPPTESTGALWRFAADHACSKVFGGVSVSNGLAWSPDGRTMYFADSPRRQILAFDYDLDSGVARNRRIIVDSGDDSLGVPDGAAVDADGCYWSARFRGGRVIRFTPEGRIDRQIKVPVSRPTMCAFGGPDLRTLYITSARFRMSPEELESEPLAGALFAVDVGVAGLAEPHFAG